MNLPNKLSVLRICLVPVFVIVMMLPQNMLPYFDIWGTLLGALIFIVASLTDMLDGKIARKYNLITDFGKFIDPLADKFMVIGALLVLMYRNAGVPYVFPVLTAATMIIIFRELAVTSIRLVASSSSGVVIAAKYIGKIKTVSQIICICAVILEPLIYSLITPLSFLSVYMPLTYLTTAVTVIFTVWSGIDYLVSYWKYLDPQK